MSYQAKLIKGGKIVIPAELRREFGFKEGDMLVLEGENGRVVLQSRANMLEQIRANVKLALKHPISVESYLQDKWAEADKE